MLNDERRNRQEMRKTRDWSDFSRLGAMQFMGVSNRIIESGRHHYRSSVVEFRVVFCKFTSAE
jgi:hypothetical protein